MSDALLHTSLPGINLISKGKVRDIYALSDPNVLLFVASDRISAFDVILRNGIPDKGKILTEISIFWFKRLGEIIPNHFITNEIDSMPPEVLKYRDQLNGRSMLVQKAQVVPLEAIVRGYITGSAWSEYKRTGTVHGIPLPRGLLESQQLPEVLFTPSTKGEQGTHDENITPAQASELVGSELYSLMEKQALSLYSTATKHAEAKGLILADTKFEFGLLPESPERMSIDDRLILIDEVLTPDSSRYWSAEQYAPGGPQESFDKQYLRDWMLNQGFKKGLESGPEGHDGEGWVMPDEVTRGTKNRYELAKEMLLS